MKKHIFKIAVALSVTSAGACMSRETPSNGNFREPQQPPAPEAKAPEKGDKNVRATYYGSGDGFAGKKTASGEKFDPKGMTAAHPSLPFGTKVEVENPKTGKSVEVKINDRGPFSGKSQLDLSYSAAKELGITKSGASNVKMKVVGKDGAKEEPKNGEGAGAERSEAPVKSGSSGDSAR